MSARAGAPVAPAAAARLPRQVKLFGAVSLLNDFASEMIYPLLPALVTGVLGAGPQALGALDGAAGFAAAFGKVGGGRPPHPPGRGGRPLRRRGAGAPLGRPRGAVPAPPGPGGGRGGRGGGGGGGRRGGPPHAVRPRPPSSAAARRSPSSRSPSSISSACPTPSSSSAPNSSACRSRW